MVALVIASIGFVLAMLGLWQASKIGSHAFRANAEATATIERIQAHGEATQRRIAEVHK